MISTAELLTEFLTGISPMLARKNEVAFLSMAGKRHLRNEWRSPFYRRSNAAPISVPQRMTQDPPSAK